MAYLRTSFLRRTVQAVNSIGEWPLQVRWNLLAIDPITMNTILISCCLVFLELHIGGELWYVPSATL
jgi:hypothetical protein